MDFMVKHLQLPAKLVHFELADKRKSVMLCANLIDLEARCMKYVEDWNAMFPNNEIRFCAIEDVVAPE